MLDRIQELLRVRELSSSQFADAIGVSRPVVSHILSGRNKPSLEVVQKVIAAFPDLSLSWLLNGAGPMLERVAAAEAAKASTASAPTVARAQSVVEPALIVAPVATVAPAPVPPPPSIATEPVEAPKQAKQPRPATTPAVAVEPATPAATTAGADLAYALAEPGKTIRRIVLFYQDGTFTDFRPETGA